MSDLQLVKPTLSTRLPEDADGLLVYVNKSVQPTVLQIRELYNALVAGLNGGDLPIGGVDWTVSDVAPTASDGGPGALWLHTAGGLGTTLYVNEAGVWRVIGVGSAPATTVVTETSFGQASAVGTASTYAREDHTHGTPAAPAVLTPAASVVTETSFGQASAIGASLNYAREDHTHGTPAAPVTSAVAGSGISVSAATGAVTFTLLDDRVKILASYRP